MRTHHLLPTVCGVLMLVGGCTSAPDSGKTGEAPAGGARTDVMDLNDTPPAPIPPAARTAPAPIESAPAAEASTGPRKHVVAAKDTLYSLSRQYYGNPNQWKKIVEANPGLVPEKMPVGKTIVIP